jgi:hypothetical protein
MNSVRESETERQRGQFFVSLLQRASLFAALILFTPLSAYAYSWYSGASVGSDGTVYGWGVTDATYDSMTMVAYIEVHLISPKGRDAYYGEISEPNTVRQDVYLSFDPTDTGTYYVNSYSSGYCDNFHYWLFEDELSCASANNAYPTNFTQSGSSGTADGELYFLYQWQSSSGNTADIAGCWVGEHVTYPGQQNKYYWPSPPWQSGTYTNNPTDDSVAGNNSFCSKGGLSGTAPCVIDNQQHASFATPPNNGASFDAQQKWRYQCAGGAFGGATVDLTAYTTIHRSVTQNGSTFTYQVTKSGASSSCVLGQTCAGL